MSALILTIILLVIVFITLFILTIIKAAKSEEYTPRFMIKSEWPTYLTEKAWNSCQGCIGPVVTLPKTDNTKKSIKITKDWISLTCPNGGSFANISGAESKDHWFNPPRNGTKDNPLEIEWYAYLDASAWGNSPEMIVNSGLTDNHWSSFWSFGHGVIVTKEIAPRILVQNPYTGGRADSQYGGNEPRYYQLSTASKQVQLTNYFINMDTGKVYSSSGPDKRANDDINTSIETAYNFAWTSCGELDFMEWLPLFGQSFGRGLTSAVHNQSISADQNYPPCCFKAGDKVNYDDFAGLADNPDANGWFFGGGFTTWAMSYLKAFYPATYIAYKMQAEQEYANSIVGLTFATRDPKAEESFVYQRTSNLCDAHTYNNYMHCYTRITTSNMSLWVKFNSDPPSESTNFNITSDMSNIDVDAILFKRGFVMVLNTYADFGSNEDVSFDYLGDNNPRPTNWHQNMFFVFSAILAQGDKRMPIGDINYNNPITFTLSDIHIRGGGNYKAAQTPPGLSNDFAPFVFMSNPVANVMCSNFTPTCEPLS